MTLIGIAAFANRAAAETDAAARQVARLGRGVNVLGYDPIWSDPAKARFQPRHFRVIREGGFGHIRVNLQAFAHMDADSRLKPQFLQTLDGIVKGATAAGLMVILDEHDFNPCGKDPALCRTKLLAFWEQIAPRYRKAPQRVLFEILNEPNEKLTPEIWNALLVDALAVIRRSNPQRIVIAGPGHWNNFKELDALRLPEGDRNLVATVHYYNPFPFTHQGAPWITVPPPVGIGWGTPAERAAIETEFDIISAWSKAQRRPMLIGEFGAYDKADMPSRARWTSAVARAAEARGFAWSYWQFDSDFIAYDIGRSEWVGPIHEALAPQGAAKR